MLRQASGSHFNCIDVQLFSYSLSKGLIIQYTENLTESKKYKNTEELSAIIYREHTEKMNIYSTHTLIMAIKMA